MGQAFASRHCRRCPGARRIVAAGVIAAVGHLLPHDQTVVAVREHRPAVTRENHPAIALIVVMARDAMPVQDRLDIAGEVGNVRPARDRLDAAGPRRAASGT